MARKASSGTSKLGILISEHRVRRGLVVLYSLLALGGMGGGIAGLALGVIRWQEAYLRFGPALVWRWSGPAFLIGVGLFILGIPGLILILRLQGLAVRTYRKGFSYGRSKERSFYAWDQVTEVHTRATSYILPGFSPRKAAILLHLDHGEILHFTHALSDITGLARTIKRSVYPLLMETYKEVLQSQQSLNFGALRLSTEGVELENKRLPWESIGGVALSAGKIHVWSKGEKKSGFQVAVEQVPNVEICAHLIKKLGERR